MSDRKSGRGKDPLPPHSKSWQQCMVRQPWLGITCLLGDRSLSHFTFLGLGFACKTKLLVYSLGVKMKRWRCLSCLLAERQSLQWDTEQAGPASESAGPNEASRAGGEDPKLRFLGGRGKVEVSKRSSPDPKACGYHGLGVWADGRWVAPEFRSVTLLHFLVSCVSCNKSCTQLCLTCPDRRVEIIIICVPNAHLRRDASGTSHTARVLWCACAQYLQPL